MSRGYWSDPSDPSDPSDHKESHAPARYQRGGTEKIAAAERLRVHGAMVAMSDTLSSSITSLDELSRMVDLTDETVFM